ncbi:MAG: hypothetical protein EAY66_00630 [Sphingobacteriales bacterium]|nr:MAG: hypothetical protein EAY66_00630 [Sphingobacteriales bacterium]
MEKPHSNTIIANSLPFEEIYNCLINLIETNIEDFPAFFKDAENDYKLSPALIKKENIIQEDDTTVPFGRFFNFLENTGFYFENQYKTPETNATTDIGIIAKRYSKNRVICFVEAKRLPTPPSTKREQTEYVFYKNPIKQGGIERFKTEKHAGKEQLHFSIMLGYIREQTPQHWYTQVNKWIESQISISSNPEINWTNKDKLEHDTDFKKNKISKFTSEHSRKTLKDLKLIHYWIDFT